MNSIKQINYLNQIGQRPQLEDSIYPKPGDASLIDKLFLVCDGVGGESLGEEASRIVSEKFAAYFEQNPLNGAELNKAYINRAQQQVLAAMRAYAALNPDAAKMSTTLTLALVNEQAVTVAWCGDSRVYHVRAGKVLWRSTDHSLVANLVKHGEITEEEAATHPQRNVITRSLSAAGGASEIDVHRITDVRDGDYLLLCTDGILEQINEERLERILLNDREDKGLLFMAYCDGKTKDNFSMYLLKLSSNKPVVAPKTNGPGIYILLAFIVALIVAGVFYTRIGGQQAALVPQKHNTIAKVVRTNDTAHGLPSRLQPDVTHKQPVTRIKNNPSPAHKKGGNNDIADSNTGNNKSDTAEVAIGLEVPGLPKIGARLRVVRGNGQPQSTTAGPVKHTAGTPPQNSGNKQELDQAKPQPPAGQQGVDPNKPTTKETADQQFHRDTAKKPTVMPDKGGSFVLQFKF